MSVDNGSSALVTVTSDSFVAGTVVMLHSFLTHNHWFGGDLIVISNNLSPKSEAILKQSFQQIEILQTSKPLMDRLDILTESFPKMKSRVARFYSLDAIGMDRYDRLLFCDSDLLYQSSIEHLFQSDDPLICCGDGPYFRGNVRNSVTFDEQPKTGADGELDKCFNAGFMIMDKTIRTKKNHEALIAMIDADRWSDVETLHTDQLLYNLHFNGQQTLIDSSYNFMMAHRFDIFKHSGLRLEDAHIIHFNGQAKPWIPQNILAEYRNDPALVFALKHWNEAFQDFLSEKSIGMATS